jgi:short-subunit dehydrogenase involved in D-alanine esterification of teichoic acids
VTTWWLERGALRNWRRSWKPVTLEVRDEAAAKSAVRLAVETFGRLDVLVNNAGYGQIAPFEQMSAEDFQAVMDTCFYGVVYTTRAAIPVMRRQKSGYIFQVSSVGGRLAVAGNTQYHAAKWAYGLAAKRLDRVVNLEKHLLCHVFRFRNKLPAQNRNREAKHQSAIAANQLREGLLVAALRADHELGTALHWR